MGEEELDIRGGFANPERASEILQQIQLFGPASKLVRSLFDVLDADASGIMEADEGHMFFRLLGCPDAELDYYWEDLLRAADGI